MDCVTLKGDQKSRKGGIIDVFFDHRRSKLKYVVVVKKYVVCNEELLECAFKSVNQNFIQTFTELVVIFRMVNINTTTNNVSFVFDRGKSKPTSYNDLSNISACLLHFGSPKLWDLCLTVVSDIGGLVSYIRGI